MHQLVPDSQIDPNATRFPANSRVSGHNRAASSPQVPVYGRQSYMGQGLPSQELVRRPRQSLALQNRQQPRQERTRLQNQQLQPPVPQPTVFEQESVSVKLPPHLQASYQVYKAGQESKGLVGIRKEQISLGHLLTLFFNSHISQMMFKKKLPHGD
jgi:hypothetical protein